MSEPAAEATKGKRFAFGHNWMNFLSVLDDTRIEEAMASLRGMLEVQSLAGRTFIDVGSGSGLFSLAARRLGASVHSFDFDPDSVRCTAELKRRYFPEDRSWIVEEGSVLDQAYLSRLGKFDVVYSWGVLHHTGHLWEAMENVTVLVKPEGLLAIAIYNRQTVLSGYWTLVKRTYHRSGTMFRRMMEYAYFAFFVAELLLADLVRGRNPSRRHRGEGRRGMSIYHDVVDWIGGWPFEVAAPREVLRYYEVRRFELVRSVTCGFRHGCNQFVLRRHPASP